MHVMLGGGYMSYERVTLAFDLCVCVCGGGYMSYEEEDTSLGNGPHHPLAPN